jgi:hypothetical protein
MGDSRDEVQAAVFAVLIDLLTNEQQHFSEASPAMK